MFRETGCDGVMVGRGALGNPWIIGNILSHLAGGSASAPSLAEREETVRHHLALAIDYYGEKVGTRDFRKHLLWYTKGLRGRRPVPPGGGENHRSGCGLEGPAGLFPLLVGDRRSALRIQRRRSGEFPEACRRVSGRKLNGLFLTGELPNKVLTFMGQVGIINAKFARCRGPVPADIHD